MIGSRKSAILDVRHLVSYEGWFRVFTRGKEIRLQQIVGWFIYRCPSELQLHFDYQVTTGSDL